MPWRPYELGDWLELGLDRESRNLWQSYRPDGIGCEEREDGNWAVCAVIGKDWADLGEFSTEGAARVVAFTLAFDIF